MRKLLRPQTAFALIGSAPRITAGMLRLAGGVIGAVAARLDPRAEQEGRRGAERGRAPAREPGGDERSQELDAEGDGGGRGAPAQGRRAANQRGSSSRVRPARPSASRSPASAQPSRSERSAAARRRRGKERPTAKAQPERPEPAAPPPTGPAVPLGPGTGHVDEEVELVGEFSDPGAEDGAGANVHVAEPWSGYAQMHADEIIDHLATVADSALALVELYEQTHRRRRTVLEAAGRELRARANRTGA
jgi:hypothetical protein